ncbi:MAG TPA: condensation domain-containing protein, partial [Blastocatellia bacterium]|nr:condensation domain-containing protein [Blastocatellia bacterium]
MSVSSNRNPHFSSKKRAAFEALLRKEGLSKPDFRAIAPRADSAPPPLSPAQQGLWFINELDPGNLSYTDSFAFRLIGQIDIKALSQSINEVIRRHESLRTAFRVIDGMPVQIINPSLSLPVSVIDLTGLPESVRAAEAQSLAATQARLPFDLTTGPLLRVSLSRLDINEHILLFTVHHMVSDGWSLGLLVKELSALYEAFSHGEPSPLAELPIQYADYAAWEQGRLIELIELHLPFWRDRLAAAPASLDLPTDRPRPPA